VTASGITFKFGSIITRCFKIFLLKIKKKGKIIYFSNDSSKLFNFFFVFRKLNAISKGDEPWTCILIIFVISCLFKIMRGTFMVLCLRGLKMNCKLETLWKFYFLIALLILNDYSRPMITSLISCNCPKENYS
jgi:hypothetical protein